MAEDARIRKTKEKLSAAFVELMKEQCFCEITPAKICEKAGVNRSTFYRNYKNTTQLKEEIEQKIIDSVNWNGQQFDPVQSKKSIMRQLDFLREKADTFRVLSSGSFESSIFQKLEAKMVYSARDQYPMYEDKISYTEYDHECVFYICAIVGIIYGWYKGGMKERPEDLADYIIEKLNSGFLLKVKA